MKENGLALITNCHIRARAPITSQARLRRSTILSALGPTSPHGFNFLMGHPSWDCSLTNSLNFRVPMEPKASELPKDIVLGKDRNIHIRLRGSTPLGDDCSCVNSLNFEVPMEPEASELPKGLTMWDIIIHPLRGPTSLLTHFRSWIGSDTKLSHPFPMEPEANEFPKGFVLGRYGNIHIRFRGSTPLGDVGCYNPPL
ncbi:unnamed protein product [Malus baccata var. baccata]